MSNELKVTGGEWFSKREGFSTVYVFSRIGGGLVQEVAACGPTNNGPHRGPWHCADCVAKHKTN